MDIKRIELSGDWENSYFQEKDQEILKKLREKAAEENDEKYREEHRHHCFRCGTPSLVEVKKGSTKIDICVNEGCGSVHLDAGELEEIIKDQKIIKNVRSSIFDVFKQRPI